ncbi:hypothetical protein FQR65_LT11217 [Abscondita terminalis]|nr:hypothetical protein FQR65_LT11217 [Abscondita terminalis]
MSNLVIKRGLFGARTWILKVNERYDNDDDLKTSKRKLAAYFVALISSACVVAFGAYLSFGTRPVAKRAPPGLCECEKHQVCIKFDETSKPTCAEASDRNDPTGCGGLCQIDEEYCKRIDLGVYQCRRLNKLNCSREQFNCGNRCVPLRMRCDGVIDCSGFVDEKNCECDLSTHFRCGNATSCFHLSRRCDGVVDCWDNFDEIGCGFRCPGGKAPCRNGQCVNKEYFCDGRFHCMDKSDEFRGCEMDR